MTSSNPRVSPKETPNSGGRRYGGVDQDERHQQRRERLIDAALTVFGDQGYHQSTVRDVCNAAQLTSRYFYESFDSMEALFQTVYERVSEQLMQNTVAALARSEPEPDKLAEAALRAFFSFIQEDPRRARVTLIDALNVSNNASQLAAKVNHDFARMTSTFMTHFLPNIVNTGLNATLLAEGLIGASNRIGTVWVADKCRMPFEEVLANALALFKGCFAHVNAHGKKAAPR
jgi:AcrR family transcriptional regulator